MDDREITRRCRCGQPAMLDLVIGRHQIPLYTLRRRPTREKADVDDLFQDTWCRAVASLGDFDPERAFRPWLLAICVNRYRDRYRRSRRWSRRIARFLSRREHEDALARAPSPDPAADTLPAHGERVQAAREAADALEEPYRLPVPGLGDRDSLGAEGIGASEGRSMCRSPPHIPPLFVMSAIHFLVVATLVHRDAARRGMDPWLWATIAAVNPSSSVW